MAYVWDVYNTATKYAQVTSHYYSGMSFSANDYYGKGYTFNEDNGKYTLTSYSRMTTNTSISGKFYVTQANNGMYLGDYVTNTTMFRCNNFYFGENENGYYWSGTADQKYTSTTTQAKGDVINPASSDNSSAYPQDAISGSYWYTFRGAPSGISYPATANPGESITITWTAGTNPLYYRVERSTDGGSTWTVLSAVVTATTYTDTDIATSSAAQVMYRVCTLGEMAVTDYSTGSVLTIPRSAMRVKLGGSWVRGSATYKKTNGTWAKLSIEEEQSTITADSKYHVIQVG